jgi:hypothetical protein
VLPSWLRPARPMYAVLQTARRAAFELEACVGRDIRSGRLLLPYGRRATGTPVCFSSTSPCSVFLYFNANWRAVRPSLIRAGGSAPARRSAQPT